MKESEKKNSVLVIGGSGFLGSHIADELSENGYTVSVFDNRRSPWLRKDQEMVIGNILDMDMLLGAIAGKEYVYHLAGVADIGEAAGNPQKTITTNIIGTTNVIEACLKHKVKRLLFASTVYVYSQQGSFYRVSKQAAELILENYFETYGLEYTIMRYGSLYGNRSQEWNGLRKYISQAVKYGKIEYNGTGQERREYIHASDAARLSVQALKNEYANQCLTLTGTQTLSSGELMNMIGEILGGKIEVVLNSDNVDQNHYSVTPYRFTPKVAKKIIAMDFYDLGQGILDMIEEIYNGNNE